MNETTIAIIIVAVIGFIGTLATVWGNYQIAKLHKDVNGRISELIRTTKELGKAEGVAEQKAKNHP